uniref:Ig-like domain-containing protein n=1 Tax=Ornithorhynchus anatinus TaxID=9258 RepID=K7E815_ORNAN
ARRVPVPRAPVPRAPTWPGPARPPPVPVRGGRRHRLPPKPPLPHSDAQAAAPPPLLPPPLGCFRIRSAVSGQVGPGESERGTEGSRARSGRGPRAREGTRRLPKGLGSSRRDSEASEGTRRPPYGLGSSRRDSEASEGTRRPPYGLGSPRGDSEAPERSRNVPAPLPSLHVSPPHNPCPLNGANPSRLPEGEGADAVLPCLIGPRDDPREQLTWSWGGKRIPLRWLNSGGPGLGARVGPLGISLIILNVSDNTGGFYLCEKNLEPENQTEPGNRTTLGAAVSVEGSDKRFLWNPPKEGVGDCGPRKGVSPKPLPYGDFPNTSESSGPSGLPPPNDSNPLLLYVWNRDGPQLWGKLPPCVDTESSHNQTGGRTGSLLWAGNVSFLLFYCTLPSA